MGEVVRIGVVGCGRWGIHHVRNFSTLPGSEVVAVCDPDERRLADARSTYAGLRASPDASELLTDPTLDAVVVATPTSTHYGLVREALEAGRHVLCEKPLCTTEAEARQLVELGESQSVLLMVGHVFLFNGGIVRLKDLVDGGDLGALYYLSAVRTNLGPIRDDVNAAYDLAAHDVAIFNWILGREPEVLSATGSSFLQRGIEDVVSISLEYPGNVRGFILASWLNPKKVRQITAVGTDKMAIWDDLEIGNPVAVHHKGANAVPEPSDYGEFLRLSMWDGDVHLLKVDMEEPLRAQDRYFLECVRRGAVDRSDGRFAAGVVRALEGVARSLSSGGAPVRLR